MNPSINDLKVYTPAQDFELSKQFYSALGFELTEAWGGAVDCRLGGAQFRLQNYYVKDWANNFMMLFGVEDVQAWYQHAKGLIDHGDLVPREYPNRRLPEGATFVTSSIPPESFLSSSSEFDGTTSRSKQT